ncbi:uncharacterized protein [Pyrus communis]|uniref:uncharacterized protein n=1 Tax=Pyrus communis TaxID=23211 RepID=UPI0035C083FF
MAKDLAVKKLAIHSDSQLITSYTTGECKAKHPRMTQYLEKTRKQLDYLVNDTLITERLESRKLQIKAKRYYMWNGVLVQRSYTGPHIRCLAPPDDLKVLSLIHEGICGNHFGGRSLAQKALNASYYWPTMHQNAKELVQKCDCYQRYKPVPALPASKLHL